MRVRSFVTGLTLLTCNVQAATLIDIRSPDGLARVYADGPRLRVNTENAQYLLADRKTGTLQIVDPAQRRVTDMSLVLKLLPPAQAGSTPAVTFEKQGSGPRIAGYPTTHYRYSGNGEACGTLFASKAALQDNNLQDAFELLRQLGAYSHAMLRDYSGKDSACDQIGRNFPAYIEHVGIPMRVIDTRGKPRIEILRMDKQASVPADTFSVPAGYRNLGVTEMMRDSGVQLPQLQQNVPIPPALLEQFRQMQKP